MNGLSIGILALFGLFLTAWYLVGEPVACRTFLLRDDRSSRVTMGLSSRAWVISGNLKLLYLNRPDNLEDFTSFPPESGWLADRNTSLAERGRNVPTVDRCVGRLEDSPLLAPGQGGVDRRSNLELLVGRPVTSGVLAGICYLFYHMWAYAVEPSAVWFSYDLVVHQGEYWRVVTASFAHADTMHLVFNAMALYQVGELEDVLGSAAYLYLSLDLVLVTMGMVTAIYHVLIHKYNRPEVAHQPGVGYSCVLFAWMVVESTRMRQFCPLFFMPSFCFATVFIPNPLASLGLGPAEGLALNAGPLLLLVATKIIIPRSSFLGHLTGVVAGYPLAWGAMDWMTPPMTAALVALLFLRRDTLLPWRLPAYDQRPDLSEFVPPMALRKFLYLRVLMGLLCLLSVASVLVSGPAQLLPRAVMGFLAWGAVHARRCQWLTDLASAHRDCASLLLLAAAMAGCLAGYDAASAGACLGARLLLEGCGLGSVQFALGASLFCMLAVCEALGCGVLVGCLHEMPTAEASLAVVRCDAPSIEADLKRLGLRRTVQWLLGVAPSDPTPMPTRTNVFDRPGRTLGGFIGGSGGGVGGGVGALSDGKSEVSQSRTLL